jgi:hypothetical protein
MQYDPNLISDIGSAVRGQTSPILSKQMFQSCDLSALGPDPMGNINGPSIMRVPDWVINPLGAYYLYFAHHKGTSIRLAYADYITGPWCMHPEPVLHLKNSLFVTNDLDPTSRKHWVNGPEYLYAHIASPDVHIDPSKKQIMMFFHGLLSDGDQQTRLATSSNGLTFAATAPLLGPSYLRAFQWYDRWYSTHLWGEMGVFDTFSKPPEIMPHTSIPNEITGAPHSKIRHGQMCILQNHAYFVFSRIGDYPEQILLCRIAPALDHAQWRFGPVMTLLSPTHHWEGFGGTVMKSEEGSSKHLGPELRDPCLFYDSGSLWLLYSGGGERGIGLAKINHY